METKEMTMEELIAFINSHNAESEFVIHVELGEEAKPNGNEKSL